MKKLTLVVSLLGAQARCCSPAVPLPNQRTSGNRLRKQAPSRRRKSHLTYIASQGRWIKGCRARAGQSSKRRDSYRLLNHQFGPEVFSVSDEIEFQAKRPASSAGKATKTDKVQYDVRKNINRPDR